ncbi:MAG TPA: ExeM/NucH family extracellular endonuclease [Euzebyales bacterium]
MKAFRPWTAILATALMLVGLLPTAAGAQTAPVINEFVANHAGTDTTEFIEVAGAPSTDLSGLTVLEIEGDGTGAGVVDGVFDVGTTNADGYWTTDFLNNEIENGTITLLLVEGFAGAAGDDLDADNDGAPDSAPWSAILDAVAVTDGDSDDLAYADVVLAPGFDGDGFTPGGASRIPDATDTDAVADWTRNDFDGAGLPGFAGTLDEGEALNTPGAENTTELDDGLVLGSCGDDATLIHDVQGDGATSPLVGGRVVVEGVVVGDFQTGAAGEDGDLGGFYVQEEDADADTDLGTSEGVFVFDDGVVVGVGDVVRVLAGVSEFETSGGASSQTQLSGAEVLVCGDAPLPAPATVTLPVDSPDVFESYEGMRTVFPQNLVISEYFNYDRFGEIVLSLPFGDPALGEDRLFQPTAVVEPGTEAIDLAGQIELRRITLDDGLSSQNPEVTRHPNGEPFALDNRFRGGDLVGDAIGVIDETFGLYRIQPTAPADYTQVNPRDDVPDVGGDVTVATFNVLNYFLTLDGSGPICGPDLDQDCRGADTAEEFERQRAKILAALAAIDADVFGLIEMENTTGVSPLADIVDGLNDLLGPGTYDYIDTGTIGSDAIKVGIIYKPANVTPVGDYAILDSSVDPRFLDEFNRPVLAQTFADDGGVFTVAVNHLKSKGSDCDDVGDPDTGDGQGNCNVTRTQAAEALADWLATDPTGSGDADVLIIGDLNSYDHEDPIDALREGADDDLGTADDYTDLLLAYQGELAYTYVFDGLVGYLDYAMANQTLTRQVTGAAAWHINADEPDILDYDTSFKSDGQAALYEPNPYRSSDHDPVIVGLDLNASPVCEAAVAGPDRLFPPNHQFVEIAIDGVTDPEGDPVTIVVDSIFSDEAVDAEDSGDTAPDARGVGESTAEVRAERVGDGNGRVYTIGFTATDAFGGSCTGEVTVGVPVGRRGEVVNDGPDFDATVVP